MAQPDGLQLTRSDLRDELARYMSFGVFTKGTTQGQRDINAFIKRGLRQFYNPPPLPGDTQSHSWSFLQPWETLLTVAPYAVGTIEVTGAAVTGNGTTFTSAMIGRMFHSGSQVRKITAFTDGTHITLDRAVDSTISAGTSYKILANSYSLPVTFGGIVGDMSFFSETGKSPIQNIGEANFRRVESEDPSVSSRPSVCCVIPADDTSGEYPDNPTRFKMYLWPNPDAIYAMRYKYVAIQGDEDDSPAGTFLGGVQHSETILTSCLSIAEEYAETPSSRYRELFLQRLSASIMMDRRMNTPDNLGKNLDRSDMQGQYRKHSSDYTVSYFDINGNQVGP
tara:strand:+ start:5610 stop:6620 length:1011 start_codon:yes stop_codon:yes gene_type:complete